MQASISRPGASHRRIPSKADQKHVCKGLLTDGICAMMASTFGEFCFNFDFEERKKPFLLYRFLNLAGQDWSIIYRFATKLSIFVVNHFFSSAAFLYFVLKIPALLPTLSIICCSNLKFQSLVRLSPTPPQLIAFLELPPRCVKIPYAINQSPQLLSCQP